LKKKRAHLVNERAAFARRFIKGEADNDIKYFIRSYYTIPTTSERVRFLSNFMKYSERTIWDYLSMGNKNSY